MRSGRQEHSFLKFVGFQEGGVAGEASMSATVVVSTL